MVAESAGKVWLFTLGPTGGRSPGGTKVTDVGPIPRVVAPQHLLRINERGADVPMQVSSSGATDLHALVMFVVDATRPFPSPATIP